MGLDGIFHLDPPFFPLPNWEEKGKENDNEKKSKKLSPLFHTSTFNNKGITEIYSLFFHFSILPTKYTW